MKVTQVKVRKIIEKGAVRGLVSVTLDGCLAIHEIRVMRGKDRDYLSFPGRTGEDGVRRDLIHPIDPATRNRLEEPVLEAFYQALLQDYLQGGNMEAADRPAETGGTSDASAEEGPGPEPGCGGPNLL